MASTSATASFTQDLGSPNVTVTEISEGGVLGQFYMPPGPGPFPAVIVLSGSNGGLTVRRPKILAADAYAVLSLPYFNYTSPIDGTAASVDDDRAPAGVLRQGDRLAAGPTGRRPQPDRDLRHLARRSGGDACRRQIPGDQERDRDLAADGHVGRRPGQVRASASRASPSRTSHRSGSRRWRNRSGKPWRRGPALPADDPRASSRRSRPTLASRQPSSMSRRSTGSVLVVSGTEDTQLPGVVYGELAMDRLKAHDFAFPYRHIIGEGAGHLVDVPSVDRSTEISEGGGDPASERAGRRGDVAGHAGVPRCDEVGPDPLRRLAVAAIADRPHPSRQCPNRHSPAGDPSSHAPRFLLLNALFPGPRPPRGRPPGSGRSCSAARSSSCSLVMVLIALTTNARRSPPGCSTRPC